MRIANPSSLSGMTSPSPEARVQLPTSDGVMFASGMGFDLDGALWVAMSNRILKIDSPGSLMGQVTANPSVVLGLLYYPDLASKVVFWPGSP